MLNDFGCSCPVYLAYGYTDLRRGIDGLAGIVQQEFHLDPYQKALFLFCGRRKDRMKGLYWEGDGFLLVYNKPAEPAGGLASGTAAPCAEEALWRVQREGP